jgi:membrane protease YdiL (CAAX protease family)
LQPVNPTDFTAIGGAGVFHLCFFGLLLPWAAIRSKKKLEDPRNYPPRRKHFSATILQQILFCVVSIVVARREWIPIFTPYTPSARDVGAGFMVLVLLVFAMAGRWKRNVDKRLPKIELFSPRDVVERTLWILVSIAAGVGEEITYRGVMYALLARVTGIPDVAALACAALFGASHMVQGWKSALVIIVFGLVFQGLVATTGTLYVAMAVHCAYDVTAGMVYGTLCKRRDATAPVSAAA